MEIIYVNKAYLEYTFFKVTGMKYDTVKKNVVGWDEFNPHHWQPRIISLEEQSEKLKNSLRATKEKITTKNEEILGALATAEQRAREDMAHALKENKQSANDEIRRIASAINDLMLGANPQWKNTLEDCIRNQIAQFQAAWDQHIKEAIQTSQTLSQQVRDVTTLRDQIREAHDYHREAIVGQLNSFAEQTVTPLAQRAESIEKLLNSEDIPIAIERRIQEVKQDLMQAGQQSHTLFHASMSSIREMLIAPEHHAEIYHRIETVEGILGNDTIGKLFRSVEDIVRRLDELAQRIEVQKKILAKMEPQAHQGSMLTGKNIWGRFWWLLTGKV